MNKISEHLLREHLDAIGFNEIARQSGADNPHTKKITAYHLLMGFFLLQSKAGRSFEDWARCIGQISGEPVSRQAVHLKQDEHHVCCFERTVEAALLHALRQRSAHLNPSLLEPFGRVLVEDSTLLRLNERLAEHFPSSHNAPTGSARWRWVIDLKSENALSFTLGSFRTNDQSQARLILPLLEPGDLLLRDLGYFTTAVLRQIADRSAFFLSRLRYNVAVYEAASGGRLDLVDLSRGSPAGVIDRMVVLGQDERVPVRLVGVRLPEAQAAQRRRKARAERHSRSHHGDHYMQWLAWSFFVTNVDASVWKPQELVQVYRLRWRIETLFKAVKSGLNAPALLQADLSYNRARIVLYGMVLFVLLVLLPAYREVMPLSAAGGRPAISLVKFASWLRRHLVEVWMVGLKEQLNEILRHCRYERRRGRKNYYEQLFAT